MIFTISYYTTTLNRTNVDCFGKKAIDNIKSNYLLYIQE